MSQVELQPAGSRIELLERSSMLCSVNEEVYLSKWMHISDLRKVLFHVLYNIKNFIHEFV